MQIELWRYNSDADSTLGIMFENHGTTREKLCVTCEDGYRAVKVPGETRIPAGRYQIQLRKGSPMARRYSDRMSMMAHPGMLWLQGVYGFKWVYIHIGNDEDDTEGCILVGDETFERRRVVMNSELAYRGLYPRLRDAVPEGLWITIYDLDRPVLPNPLN